MKIFISIFLLFFLLSCDNQYLTEDDIKELPIAITEIMYNLDENDSSQFIEIKNVSSKEIDLSGFSIAGGVNYTFEKDSKTLEPQEFLLLVNSKIKFKKLYPDLNPFDEFEGNLSIHGDDIVIYSPFGEKITEVSYTSQYPWPLLANGKNRSLVPIEKNPLEKQNNYKQWRVSALEGGSPMANDPYKNSYNLTINEYFPGNNESEAFVELYNKSDKNIDISNWFLSNNYDDLKKYKFPENSIIEANNYLSISEKDIDSTFLFGNGEFNIIISEGVNDSLTGFSTQLHTFYCNDNQSIGYYKTDCGNSDISLLKEKSKNEQNGDYKLGDIIFSEIMYHPKDDGYEYLVLENLSDKEIILSKKSNSELFSWKIKGINYNFIENSYIQANSKLILFKGDVSDIDTFRRVMDIDSTINIYTYSGSLSNSGEELQILKPENLIIDKNGNLKNEYSLSDKVHYYDGGNWPKNADGYGYSLIRKEKNSYGDCYKNWKLSEGNNGIPNL